MPATYSGNELVEIAIQIESCGEAFYEEALKYMGEGKAKEIFTYLRDEEKHHAETFEKLLSRISELDAAWREDENYISYMRALAENRVFPHPEAAAAAAKEINDPEAAVKCAIGFEKDTILFFYELRPMVKEEERAIVDELIAEEQSHVRTLSGLLKALRQDWSEFPTRAVTGGRERPQAADNTAGVAQLENEGGRFRVELDGGEVKEVEAGTLIRSLAPMTESLDERPLVAIANNSYVELDTPITEDTRVSFATLRDRPGLRAYRRGLGFLLSIAASGCIPGARIVLEHSLGKCVYGRMNNNGPVSSHTVARIRDEMLRLIMADLPIQRLEMTVEEARRIFTGSGDQAKLKLLSDWPHDKVVVHRCAGVYELFPGPTVERTGLLNRFDLRSYPPGFILCLPDFGCERGVGTTGDRPNLFRIFYEYERWSEVLGTETAGDLNETVAMGRSDDLVWVAEALHEKKIAAIADKIVARAPLPRIILIAGPSSSGKTTFCRRLAIQLRVLGLKPETISVDNYFVEREKTPKDENGEYDFETIEAIDVSLLSEHLEQLLDGRMVMIPHFDFGTGQRREGRSLRLEPGRVLLVEGIHCLNPALTPRLWPHLKYKIYVSALTTLNVDDQNAISTSDVRLVRRIVRDCHSRGYDARETIERWPSVRAGEEKWIFPHQESADVMFNTALAYELNALREPALEALASVPSGSAAAAEAQRLAGMLKLFRPLPDIVLPPTSILQEFLGGSAFREVR